MFAHYFKFGKKYYLVISESTRPLGPTIPVENKKAARQLANKIGATPYNF
jgi:hypothetical protein